MVVNMACPSCGKQATEYDEHKWSCLHCGNKFVFVPPTSPQTNNYVQSTVNAVGQPTYELDVQRAKPAKPIIKTRYEYNPEEFSYPPESIPALDQEVDFTEGLGYGTRNVQEIINRNRNSKIIWLCWSALFGILAFFGMITGSWLLICIFPAAVSVINLCIRFRDTGEIDSMVNIAEARWRRTEQERIDFEARKNEKITVGYQPVCPFCIAEIIGTSAGLTHCQKCGKQFHYSNERSYPLKFR
jgi:ribosomal protein L37AE/L43A